MQNSSLQQGGFPKVSVGTGSYNPRSWRASCSFTSCLCPPFTNSPKAWALSGKFDHTFLCGSFFPPDSPWFVENPLGAPLLAAAIGSLNWYYLCLLTECWNYGTEREFEEGDSSPNPPEGIWRLWRLNILPIGTHNEERWLCSLYLLGLCKENNHCSWCHISFLQAGVAQWSGL